MTSHKTMRRLSNSGRLLAGVSALALSFAPFTPVLAANAPRTPIQHVIVIIGENHSFDQVFATYTPATAGQTVSNLLDQRQQPAVQFSRHCSLCRAVSAARRSAPAHDGRHRAARQIHRYAGPERDDAAERAVPGFQQHVVPVRNSYRPSPVHRFYQLWQQTDCSVAHATAANPSGCLNDLFPWVESTIGAGNNGAAQPANFTNQTTGEGSTAMGFLNVAHGDAPYLTQLANQYAMSDNFHQSIEGGTGANHIALNSGLAFYYEANGQPATSASNQIENPNSQPGNNNCWVQDGYSGGSLLQLLRSNPTGRRAGLGLSGFAAVASRLEMRPERVLPVSDFDAPVANNTLPAVSITKPDGLTDGHPASSKLDLFEAFTKRLVQEVQANPAVWASTAILITMDEGGGYSDSDYIQPLDFFGDGTRIPAIMVSPYSMGGRNQPLLHRPRVVAEVHRVQLELLAGFSHEPRQSSQPDRDDRQSLRADQLPRDRRSDGHVPVLVEMDRRVLPGGRAQP